MGAFSRIRYVIAANVNALLEKAENPEKLLRALIREMEDAGEDARLAAAELLAEKEHLGRVAAQLESEIAEWQDRAEKAVATDRDDLARTALKAKAELTETLEATHDEHALLDDRIAHLEADMQTLKGKLAEAKLKLREMLAKGQSGPAAPERADARLSPNERKIRRAMDRFDRLQSQVERLEARVRSYEVGGTAPSVWEPEALVDDPTIEAELEALKAKTQKAVAQDVPAAEAADTPDTEEA